MTQGVIEYGMHIYFIKWITAMYVVFYHYFVFTE